MAQKTTHFILTATRLGVAVVVIVSLLWVINQNLLKLTPTIPGQKTLAPLVSTETHGLVTSSATPTHKVTPTETESVPRTEAITYTIQEHDTIFGIAEKFNLQPETILLANEWTLDGCNLLLTPGKELYILPVNGAYYKWKEGDDLNLVAKRLRVQPEDIINWPGNHLDLKTLGDLSRPNIKPGTMLVVPGGQHDFPCSMTPYP